MINNNALKKSLIFSICYVGLSTLALLSVYPNSNFYGEWTIYAIIVTLPVSALSMGVRIAGSDYEILIILLIQIIMFLLTWLISYRLLKNRFNK